VGVLKEALKTQHPQVSNERTLWGSLKLITPKRPMSFLGDGNLTLSSPLVLASAHRLPEMSRQSGEESRAANDPSTRVCVAMRTRHLHLVAV
jgi:hypothetical protein